MSDDLWVFLIEWYAVGAATVVLARTGYLWMEGEPLTTCPTVGQTLIFMALSILGGALAVFAGLVIIMGAVLGGIALACHFVSKHWPHEFFRKPLCELWKRTPATPSDCAVKEGGE